MKFGIIDPQAKVVDIFDADDKNAQARARLPKDVHHGVLCRLPNGHRVCCVVDDFGFYRPVAEQHYFAIDGRLIAGRAFIYEAGYGGHTVDLSDEAAALIQDVTWFESSDEVEIAIAAGAVPRPTFAINNDVIWAWPEPPPPEFAERMKQ